MLIEVTVSLYQPWKLAMRIANELCMDALKLLPNKGEIITENQKNIYGPKFKMDKEGDYQFVKYRVYEGRCLEDTVWKLKPNAIFTD